MQKRWRVGRTDRVDPTTIEPRIELSEPHDLPVPNGFTFTADPCPGPDGEIFCEAMDVKSGKGRIVVFTDGHRPAEVELPRIDGQHCSYPFVVEHAGRRYLVPEMTRVGPPRLFELDGTSVVSSRILAGLEDLRIVDPTLLFRAGRWWLFGGLPGTAADLLYLWSAPELAGPYTPHPDNPVVMDVARARPAGPIIVAADGRLFRPGQDNRGGYGDGITVSEIVEWTAETYTEEPRAEVKVGGRKGPHTLFVTNDATIVDSYVEKFDALAWLNRIKNKLAS
jgi:hypothetical protein